MEIILSIKTDRINHFTSYHLQLNYSDETENQIILPLIHFEILRKQKHSSCLSNNFSSHCIRRIIFIEFRAITLLTLPLNINLKIANNEELIIINILTSCFSLFDL